MIEVKKLNGGPEDYDFLVRLCSLALEWNASLDGSISFMERGCYEVYSRETPRKREIIISIDHRGKELELLIVSKHFS